MMRPLLLVASGPGIGGEQGVMRISLVDVGHTRSRRLSYCAEHPPSSPSIAILRDGQLLYMLERHQIENQTAETIARILTEAFDTFCASAAQRAQEKSFVFGLCPK